MLHITTEDSNRSESRSYTFCFIIIFFFWEEERKKMGECVRNLMELKRTVLGEISTEFPLDSDAQ